MASQFDPYSTLRRLFNDDDVGKLNKSQVVEMSIIAFNNMYLPDSNRLFFQRSSTSSLKKLKRKLNELKDNSMSKYLLSTSIGITPQSHTTTALRYGMNNAAYHGHIEVLNNLVGSRRLSRKKLKVLVEFAALGGQLVMFNHLLSLGAKWKSDVKLAKLAIVGGNFDIIKSISPLNQKQAISMIESVVITGRMDVLEYLLTLIPDKNSFYWKDEWIEEAISRKHLEMTKYLLNLCGWEDDFVEALNHAIVYNFREVIKMLVADEIRLDDDDLDQYGERDKGFVYYLSLIR